MRIMLRVICEGLRWGFILAVLLLYWEGAKSIDARVQKAERNPEPQQWMIPVNGRANGDVRVHVIDTTGVCLYVVRDSTGMDTARTIAIAAVSKDQLPKGAGCQ